MNATVSPRSVAYSSRSCSLALFQRCASWDLEMTNLSPLGSLGERGAGTSPTGVNCASVAKTGLGQYASGAWSFLALPQCPQTSSSTQPLGSSGALRAAIAWSTRVMRAIALSVPTTCRAPPRSRTSRASLSASRASFTRSSISHLPNFRGSHEQDAVLLVRIDQHMRDRFLYGVLGLILDPSFTRISTVDLDFQGQCQLDGHVHTSLVKGTEYSRQRSSRDLPLARTRESSR